MAYYRCGGGGVPKTLIYDGILPDAYTNVNITIPAGTKALALIVTSPDTGNILEGDVLIYDIHRHLNQYTQDYCESNDADKRLGININVSNSLLRIGSSNGITAVNVPVKLYAVDLSPTDF